MREDHRNQSHKVKGCAVTVQCHAALVHVGAHRYMHLHPRTLQDTQVSADREAEPEKRPGKKSRTVPLPQLAMRAHTCRGSLVLSLGELASSQGE